MKAPRIGSDVHLFDQSVPGVDYSYLCNQSIWSKREGGCCPPRNPFLPSGDGTTCMISRKKIVLKMAQAKAIIWPCLSYLFPVCSTVVDEKTIKFKPQALRPKPCTVKRQPSTSPPKSYSVNRKPQGGVVVVTPFHRGAHAHLVPGTIMMMSGNNLKPDTNTDTLVPGTNTTNNEYQAPTFTHSVPGTGTTPSEIAACDAARPLASECGTYKTVKATIWLSGENS